MRERIQGNMKSIKTILGIVAALASVGLLSSAQAVPITGMLNISGTAHYDAPIASATQITMFEDAVTGGANTGSFGGIGAMVPVSMTFPYIFNPSTPTPALWSVAGFTFNLLSSEIITQTSNGILIVGTGTITGNGFDPTPGTWGFSQQKGSGTVLTFSATTEAAVPDGGMTATLLGLGLGGLVGARRLLRKARA
jgi:hypothetical protein